MAFTWQRRTQPNRTEAFDDQGWAATFTDGSRTVGVRGAPRTFTEQSAGIADDFARSTTDGWGNSPNGGKWYSVGGVVTAYSSDGNRGVMHVTTPGIAYRSLITNAHTDIDASVRMRSSGDTNRLGVQQGMVLGYADTNNYYMATMSVVPGNIADAFDRTVSGGWGKATSGQGWMLSGGAPEHYSVANNAGVHSLQTVNSSLRSLLTASADFDCRVKIATSALAQGSSILTSILARYQDANNYYLFRVRFSSAPASRPLFIGVQKQQAGVATSLGPEVATGVNHVAGTYVWVRASCVGAQLRMKLWADGSAEPATWQTEVTDTTFTAAGQAGVRSLVSAGNTNPLPVTVSYTEFGLTQLNSAVGSVQLTLQRRAQAVTKTVATTTLTALPYTPTAYWLRVVTEGKIVRVRIWPDGATEPTQWHVSFTAPTAPAGNVGMRAYCSQEAPRLPVTFYFDTYRLRGRWVQPPVITHNVWVRLLESAFVGTVNEAWLTARLADNTVDILATSLQYLTAAPPVISGGVQISGDANYSSLYSDGGRRSGGDFNDYIGQDWHYSATSVNVADPLFLHCLDCAGFVRMVFGYRGGFPLGLSANTGKLPRTSYNLAYAAPGTMVASHSTAPPSLAALQIGDVLYFCKPTGDPSQAESQVDHVGIYLGKDTADRFRFISSRRTINGPTLADVGGASLIDDSGQYGQTLRAIRRL